jgi:hypothetical protein
VFLVTCLTFGQLRHQYVLVLGAGKRSVVAGSASVHAVRVMIENGMLQPALGYLRLAKAWQSVLAEVFLRQFRMAEGAAGAPVKQEFFGLFPLVVDPRQLRLGGRFARARQARQDHPFLPRDHVQL